MTALILPFPGARVTEHDPAAPACLIGRRLHPATDGLLCRHHLEELGRWLHHVEDEAAALAFNPDRPDDWATLPRMEASTGPGGSSLASHRSPAVLDAIAYSDPRTTEVGHRHIGPVCAIWRCPHVSCWDIRSDRDEHESGGASLVHVLSVLHGWAQQTRDERRMKPPIGDIRTPIGHRGQVVGEWLRTGPVPPTVMGERLFLTRQLDWIAGRPWVADMRRSIGDLRRQLLKLNRNQDDQPLPGWCFRLVDGQECGGHLWPTEPVYSSDTDPRDVLDGPARPRAVVCDRDSTHRWEAKGGEIARLTLIVQAQRRKDTAS